MNRLSPLEKMFKSEFGEDYSEEILEKLGYRLNESTGYLYKYNEEESDYLFEKSLLPDDSYAEQCIKHILEKKYKMFLGEELDKYI